MKKYCYNSPVGKLWIAEKEGKLSHILFEDVLLCEIEKTSVIDSVCKQKKIFLTLCSIPFRTAWIGQIRNASGIWRKAGLAAPC